MEGLSRCARRKGIFVLAHSLKQWWLLPGVIHGFEKALALEFVMSKLPHVDEALIPQRKMVNYLLSLAHESGQDKAVFFGHFGFTPAIWEIFAQVLRQHATRHEIIKIEASPFGQRCVIVRSAPNSQWQSASGSRCVVY
jgi:hypothetical protein